MIRDKSTPLYALTIGEFIELTRQVVNSVLAENPETPPGATAADQRDEHFSLAQCAKFLRCSLVSLHKYKKQGLPYYKVGRKILFKKSEVLNFMKTATKRLRFMAKKPVN